MLSLLRVWVQSLVGELRSCKQPLGTAKRGGKKVHLLKSFIWSITDHDIQQSSFWQSPVLPFHNWCACVCILLGTHSTGQKVPSPFNSPPMRETNSLTYYGCFQTRLVSLLLLLRSFFSGAGMHHPTYPHENKRFCFSFFCLRKMKVHFISIKIRIVGCTDTLVKSESPVGLDPGLWNIKQSKSGKGHKSFIQIFLVAFF